MKLPDQITLPLEPGSTHAASGELGLIFDAEAALRAKDEGMRKAAEKRRELLASAREIAREMFVRGHDPAELGNAAGSIFSDKCFEWTGTFTRSTRVISHGNLLRVWRLAR